MQDSRFEGHGKVQADVAVIDSGSEAGARPKGGKARLLGLADLDGRTRAKQTAVELRDRLLQRCWNHQRTPSAYRCARRLLFR